MKKMELSQMENLQGGVAREGDSFSCALAITGTVVGLALAPATFGFSAGATIFFGAASIVDGCIGWA